MSNNFRCRYCTDERHPGCHATCPKYAEDLEEHKAKKKYLDEQKAINTYIQNMVCERKNATAIRKKDRSGIRRPTGGR